jgi:hypothetical protein
MHDPRSRAGSDTLFCRNPMPARRRLAQAPSRLFGCFFDLRWIKAEYCINLASGVQIQTFPEMH